MESEMRIGGNWGTGVLVLAALGLGAVPASAQVAEQFTQTQRENALALRKYEWKSRVEVRREGETKSSQLFLMRYGADGNLQRTLIEGTQPSEAPRMPLKRIIVKKKTREFQETVAELSALAQSYANLSPERMQALLASANVITPVAGPSDALQVEAKNVLKTGDLLTLWIDSGTHQQRKVEIRTFLDDHPVTVVSEFRSLPQGPTYAARVVAEYPRERMQLVTDAFDVALTNP
jgi:hypothetical protein